MNFVYYFHDEKSTEQFERLLLKIKSKYRIVSTDEMYDIISNKKKTRNTCCLTVDDGWISTYEVIYPVIKKHNIPITIFVSPKSCKTGYNFWFYLLRYCDLNKVKQTIIKRGLFDETVSQYSTELILKELDINTIYSIIEENLTDIKKIPNGFINVEQLLEMKSSGLVTIGAHTMSHPILANETDEQSHFEIVESVKELSELVNEQVKYFAFPNGLPILDFGKRELEAVMEAGIKMAFSVRSNVLSRSVNLFSVPRICGEKRLDLGWLGAILPSLYNQKGKRCCIRKLKK